MRRIKRSVVLVAGLMVAACHHTTPTPLESRPTLIPEVPPVSAIKSMEADRVEAFWSLSNGGCLRLVAINPTLKGIQRCEEMKNKELREAIAGRLLTLHPEWSKPFRRALSEGVPVLLGMRGSEVLISLGEPERRNNTTTRTKETSQWIYKYPHVNVYIENGAVSAVQTNE